jgi:FixJ family two-component response regulator
MPIEVESREKWVVAIVDDDKRRTRLIGTVLTQAGYAAQRHIRLGRKMLPAGAVVLAHDSTTEGFDEALTHCVDRVHPLVLYSESPSIAAAVERMSCGAAGYLGWPFSREEATHAIQLARRVGAKKMTMLKEERQAHELIAHLTGREKEVLGYLAAGLTTKQMAAQMGLSQRTVDIFRTHLISKIGGNRATAFKIGFIASLFE